MASKVQFVGGPYHGECMDIGNQSGRVRELALPDPNTFRSIGAIDFDKPGLPEKVKAYRYRYSGTHAIVAGKHRDVYVYQG